MNDEVMLEYKAKTPNHAAVATPAGASINKQHKDCEKRKGRHGSRRRGFDNNDVMMRAFDLFDGVPEHQISFTSLERAVADRPVWLFRRIASWFQNGSMNITLKNMPDSVYRTHQAGGENEKTKPLEFASLVAELYRRKLIAAEGVDDAYSYIEQCAPRFYETRPRLGRALALSLNHYLSLWDCVYLVLSEECNCPVLTADVRLFLGGQMRHPSINW